MASPLPLFLLLVVARNHVDTWDKGVLGVGTSNSQGPEPEVYLEGLRNGKEAVLINIEWEMSTRG